MPIPSMTPRIAVICELPPQVDVLKQAEPLHGDTCFVGKIVRCVSILDVTLSIEQWLCVCAKLYERSQIKRMLGQCQQIVLTLASPHIRKDGNITERCWPATCTIRGIVETSSGHEQLKSQRCKFGHCSPFGRRS